jgi:polyribonucleotide nucleotidyltransferase
MSLNGLDEYIVDKCYTQAQQARLHINNHFYDR